MFLFPLFASRSDSAWLPEGQRGRKRAIEKERPVFLLLTLYADTGCKLSTEMNGKDEQLTRGEIAKRSGVNIETIRYYERRGLLPKPMRSVSGYRLFSTDDVRRVRFIKRAQELGFLLDEIAELLALRLSTKGKREDVRKLAEAKISDIKEKIKTLRAMEKSLASLATACCGGDGALSECPILESFEEE
jgi:Hg(II)-responsive transcriptional regulator